jgi:hypothetical protein
MRSAVVASTALCAALAGLATTAVDSPVPALRPVSAPTAPPPGPAAPPADVVTTETGLREAWADPRRTRIDLGADIYLRDCHTGDPIRESPYPLTLDGHGHTIRQTCFEKRLLRQDGTGHLHLQGVRLTRGGSDGPGAAVTTRGVIVVVDSSVEGNLSEEPGGGIFSMRRATIRSSRISGNLANDDGGGVYARRGGVEVYDSVLSNNLVDGSGGAVGSTGDILVVRSYVDGNTTDGDGGALYADEDGDVTVIDSFIDGSDADGPGGAIFTLDGDVAVLGSTLLGNRADDRGGAISGEADVLVVNSTLARNLAVAHVGGAVWARGDLMLVNATVTDNYAEGEGGGVIASGRTTVIGSTITRNTASVGANVGSGGELISFLSILGPALADDITGDTRPTRRACRVYAGRSLGYNFRTDDTCKLDHPTDITGDDPKLAPLEADPSGFVLLPFDGSPVRARVPLGACVAALPRHVPARQLLDHYLDWDVVLARDAVGTPREGTGPCDIGAVQSAPPQQGGARPRGWEALTLPRVPSFPAPSADERAPEPDVVQATDVRRTPALLRPVPRARRGTLASYAASLDRLGRRIQRLEGRARRWRVLDRCITPVPVDRAGDRRHRWGFLYDERDGTGLDTRPALVPHEGRSGSDLRLVRLSRRLRCLSAAVDPNGTGADARTPVTTARSSRPTVTGLLRRLDRWEARAERVERRAARFDDWSSCVSWLPVTEAGDARQDLGYRQDPDAPGSSRHVPALDLDESEWDDPDYMLLALLGRDDPRGPRECSSEPGEAVDRTPARRGTTASAPAGRPDPEDRDDLRQGIAALREDLEDLRDPVDEITQFDECMFTVGVQAEPGYAYRTRRGRLVHRPALSFDMGRDRLPSYDVLAFPGEEPPQIECNEDAGGVETDE